MSTGDQFFEFQSPRDMLEKARSEFARMKADLNTYNVFNFVITANHIWDYAKVHKIPKNELPKDADFQLCRELCNMAKHLRSANKYKQNKFSQESVKLWAEGLWAEGLWDGKQAIFEFKGKRLNIIEFAERIINRWDAILTKHGM
jgi:hypothetical protein